jgi:hypothetical protein
MGRTYTPKYAVDLGGIGTLTMAWHGRLPTVQELEQYVMEYVVSTYPGFCNEHIGRASNIRIPTFARVYRNQKRTSVYLSVSEILVEWLCPQFMILPKPKDYPKVAKALPHPRKCQCLPTTTNLESRVTILTVLWPESRCLVVGESAGGTAFLALPG